MARVYCICISGKYLIFCSAGGGFAALGSVWPSQGSASSGWPREERRGDKAGGGCGVSPAATCVCFVLKNLWEEKGKIWEGRGRQSCSVHEWITWGVSGSAAGVDQPRGLSGSLRAGLRPRHQRTGTITEITQKHNAQGRSQEKAWRGGGVKEGNEDTGSIWQQQQGNLGRYGESWQETTQCKVVFKEINQVPILLTCPQDSGFIYGDRWRCGITETWPVCNLSKGIGKVINDYQMSKWWRMWRADINSQEKLAMLLLQSFPRKTMERHWNLPGHPTCTTARDW